MDGSNPFTKIKWNKYKNPFRVKLFIFCMLAIPVFCFLVYGVYANFGGLIMSFEGLSREQEKVIPVGFANYKKYQQRAQRRGEEILRYDGNEASGRVWPVCDKGKY